MKLSLPIIGLVVILRKSLYLVSQLVDLVLGWCFSPRWPAGCTRTLFCKVERHRPCQHFWKKVKLIYEQGNAFVFLFVCLSVCFFFFVFFCCCCCFFFLPFFTICPSSCYIWCFLYLIFFFYFCYVTWLFLLCVFIYWLMGWFIIVAWLMNFSIFLQELCESFGMWDGFS